MARTDLIRGTAKHECLELKGRIPRHVGARALLALLPIWSVLAFLYAPNDAVASPSASPPLAAATQSGQQIDYPQPPETGLFGGSGPQGGSAAGVVPPYEKPGPIPFNGGYVQHEPRLFVVFYGSAWNTRAAAKEKILNLYRWLNGSTYQGILTQFFDFGGYVSPQVTLASSYTDTRVSYPPVLNSQVIMEEIAYSVAHQPGWGPYNYENQYIVVFPPGPQPSEAWQYACAAHGWSGQFTWTGLPWSPTECQRGLEPAAAMQVSASHEYAETVTDPIIAPGYRGWENEGGGGEIADICNTGTPSEQAEAAPGIMVAKLADNYLWAAQGSPNRCTAQDATPSRFAVVTGGVSFPKPHTALLSGSVNPAGWQGNYNFALTGPGVARFLPGNRNQNVEAWYGFSGVTPGFGGQAVSAEAAGLKGNTTYQVRLDGNDALTRPVSGEDVGNLFNISGGSVQFTTPSWKPIVSNVRAESGTRGLILRATIDNQGTSGQYRFEYGPTKSYGSSAPIVNAGIGSGQSEVVQFAPASEGISHFRVVATNEEGTIYSADVEARVESLPVTSNPIEIGVGPIEVDSYRRGADGKIYGDRNIGSGWEGPFALPTSAGGVGSNLAAVQNGPGVFELYWRGTDGKIYGDRSMGAGWEGPYPLPTNAGGVAGDPSIIKTSSHEVNVYWRGTDGKIYGDRSTGSGWEGPFNVPTSAGGVGSNLAAVQNGPGVFELYWRGTDGKIYGDRSTGAGWEGPYQVPTNSGGAAGDLSLLNVNSNQLDLYWRGTDGKIYGDRSTGSGWEGPFNVPTNSGGAAGTVASVRNEPGALELYWRGTDGKIYGDRSTGSGWEGPFNVPTNSGGAAGDPSWIKVSPSELNLYWRGTDGKIYGDRSYGAGWEGPWGLP